MQAAPRTYQRGPAWYADIWIDGQRTRRSLGPCKGKREAREKAAALQAVAAKSGVVQHTLHEALRRWLQADERGRTDVSILNQIVKHYPDREISEFTEDSLREAMPHLKPANWNRYVSTIKSALNRYAGTHKTPVPPVAKKRVGKKLPRYLTPAEWARLRSILTPELLGPADLAIATGLRAANVFRLQWSQVNFQNRTVTVPADFSKSGEMLHLPLSDDAIVVLRRQQGLHDLWVFPDGDGHMRLRRDDWDEARRVAKLDIIWHTFRHTFAAWHVLGGTPLIVLKDLGGWASIEMVEIYASLQPSHLQGFANNANQKIAA